jgi:hypothetical protein
MELDWHVCQNRNKDRENETGGEKKRGQADLAPISLPPIEALHRILCGHRSREHWISPLGNWTNKIPFPALPDRCSAGSHMTFRP